MKKKALSFLILSIIIVISCNQKPEVHYPESKTVDTVDNYFGTNVPDPYRWLEETKSDAVKNWVTEENKVTEDYLSQIPFRKDINKRLTKIWNYEKYSAPQKIGDKYIFSKNDGLQEQSVIYIQDGLDSNPEVLLDPNKLSDDGSVSLAGLSFSKDYKYASYSISRGGSDWREIYVMNVETRETLEDHVQWAKFTGMAWYKNGFYYSRYDEPKGEDKLKASNEYQKLYYHKIGTLQSSDALVMQDKENSKRGFGAEVTDDENYLVVTIWEGSSNENMLSYKNLKTNSSIKPVIDKMEAHYYFIDNIGNKFLVQTDYEAPNFQVVLIDPAKPQKNNWQTIIPETQNVINSVSTVGGKLFVTYLKDATSQVEAYTYDGEKLYDVEMPGVGTVHGFGGKKEDNETFYTFTSFTTPPTIYKYDIENNKSELFRKSDVKFNPDDYETKQVFYKSKDGTEVPMFIVYKKGLELNGDNPALLYAYGGFNISILPSFRLTIIPLLENGFVYASANLRGGGEYGEEWHKAGMFEKKQNVFDDFISAAEYLINENYTNSDKLAIQGGSNGGLLVGAVTNQRPDLFRVALPAVGVMDMLRYHKFTIGWAWASEYGSSEDSTQFEYLYKYSPVHNVKNGVNYPSILVTTADHDDRVFPAHSFKYIATLQNKDTGDNPQLIRIETQVGHGAGTSTSKTIDLYTDLWSFMMYNMDIKPAF